MEKDGGSFFTDLDAEDESVSLDDAELDRILAETEPATDGPSVLQDPDVIVLDYEDLNEDLPGVSPAADDGVGGSDAAVSEVSGDTALEAGSAEGGAFLTEGTGEEASAEGALPDLSGIPEPSFGGSEPSEWPEMKAEEESLDGWGEEMSAVPSLGEGGEEAVKADAASWDVAAEDVAAELGGGDGSEGEVSAWDVGEELGGGGGSEGAVWDTAAGEEKGDEVSVIEEFPADEPSAVEEISVLPDIGAGTEEPSADGAVWEPAQPVSAEEAEITPLDLGLEPAGENGGDEELFPEVEEIDLDRDSAVGSPASAEPETKSEPAAEAKIEVPVASGSFFDESDEDESVTLSADELKNILDDAVEEVEMAVPEPQAAAVAAGPAVSEESSEGVSEGALSRDNLKEILIYLDNLLDKLPEEEIRKFATSRYYDLYNAIFEELGLV